MSRRCDRISTSALSYRELTWAHAGSCHRRHRPLPDRPRRQGLAEGPAPRRPRRHHRRRRARKVPQLDRTLIEDLYLGCGLPGGEQGFNMARVVATQLGLDGLPGATDHPLLLVVAADHPDGVPRDQGRRGRRLRLGRRRDGVPVRPGQLRRPPVRRPQALVGGGWENPHFADARARTASFAAGRAARLARPARGRRGCPTSTSPWARPPRTSPRSRTSPARRWTSSAYAARTSPRRRSPTASGHARSPRSRCPTARSWRPTTARAPGVTLEAVAGLKPVFRPDGRVTAGNCCPLNDGAAAVVIMSDTKARELGHHPAGPDRLHRRHRPVPRDHGPRPGRGVPAGAARGPA